MKTILKSLLVLFVLTIGIYSNVNAQSRKVANETVSNIDTSSPTFSVILEVKDENGNEMGMLEINVIDRKHQLVGVKIRRLEDQSHGNDPMRPKIKVIQVPEISERTYKIAESMDEVYQPVDNKKVLLLDYVILLQAMKTQYN
jgi:hypothetical protein